MSSELPKGPSDSEPSSQKATSLEFESFFEQRSVGEQEGEARVPPKGTELELLDVPVMTAEQVARRARLRLGVATLVTSLGAACVALFVIRGLAPSQLDESVPVTAVSLSVGTARVESAVPAPSPPPSPPLLRPAPVAVAAAREPVARAEPAETSAAAPHAAPVLSEAPARGDAPAVARVTARSTSPSKGSQSRARPAVVSPARATRPAGWVPVAARSNRAPEATPTASFPADPE